MAGMNIANLAAFKSQCPFLGRTNANKLRTLSTARSIEGVSKLRRKAEDW